MYNCLVTGLEQSGKIMNEHVCKTSKRNKFTAVVWKKKT